jgi:ribosomal protein L24
VKQVLVLERKKKQEEKQDYQITDTNGPTDFSNIMESCHEGKQVLIQEKRKAWTNLNAFHGAPMWAILEQIIKKVLLDWALQVPKKSTFKRSNRIYMEGCFNKTQTPFFL